MAKTNLPFSLFTVFFLSLLFFPSSSLFSTSIDNFVFAGCTQQKYTPNSPYESNLDSLLSSLVNRATYASYNNITVLGSTPNNFIYGLYQCRGDLSMPDCATCVGRAVSRARDFCSQTCGGAVQLEGCYVKYDDETFFGVEDKTVILKKCGPPGGYNSDAVSNRDAVLGGLGSSGSSFRVGGSGNVQGMAQCTGDLTFVECQDCVSDAIPRLRSDCGTADYGDMFLAKCYVRYSTGGAHSYPKAHDKSSTGEGEKTFAVIVGLLAGIALLIIFLAFLRRIFEGNGK